MDTVFSGEALAADGDRGARMWVRFSDATLPPAQCRHVEARLVREGGSHIRLFNSPGAITPLASLPQDWTSATPRVRVRIRYQEVAGIPTIFFVAEDSTQWTPDLSGPLTRLRDCANHSIQRIRHRASSRVRTQHPNPGGTRICTARGSSCDRWLGLAGPVQVLSGRCYKPPGQDRLHHPSSRSAPPWQPRRAVGAGR